MGNRLAGICYIKVNGTQLEVEGGVEIPLVDEKKEPVVGSTGVKGYKSSVEVPYIKLSALFTPDFPLDLLKTNDDMTVTAELPNGRVYVLSHAWVADAPSFKGDDGKLDLTFNGKRGEFTS